MSNLFENILPAIKEKRKSIFLVGASLSDNGSNRKRFYDELKNNQQLAIYFPERLMMSVFYNNKINLLSLENLLAENVNCVVMCVESPGSIAELGAFANHDKLRNKLVIILDHKFKNKRSFINYGPL